MRKLFTLVLLGFALGLSACSSYDDTPLWDKINDHEDRISRLEEMCREMNTNIASLQTLVEAMQNGDYITGVTPITENGETVGYTITFGKGDSITIYNGKDGENGKDGVGSEWVPIIGVQQHTDGNYYWTINGEWLLDDQGNMVKAVGTDGKDGEDGKDGVDGEDGKDGVDGDDGKDGADGANGKDGKDGITPKLKIENDYWYVSYDNGATWSQLGKATGNDGNNGSGSNSIFTNVEVTKDGVIFYLSDGSTFTVPTSSQTEGDIINFLDNGVKVRCVLNWDTDGDNQLSKAEAAAVTSLEGVFRGCTSIIAFDELKYFTGLTSIEDEAFIECNSLTTITLPETITSIGSDAFYYCSRLKSITIPNSVTSIYDTAFYNCNSLKSVVLPDSFEVVASPNNYYDGSDYGVGNPFCYCKSLEAFYGKPVSADNRCIIIDNNLISVAIGGLTSYTIPEGVVSINGRACYFYDDYYYDIYTTITIPSSVTYIGYRGTYAKELNFMSPEPPTLFRSTYDDGSPSSWLDDETEVIYIPDGALSAYLASDWLPEEKSLIYFDISTVDPDQLITYKYTSYAPKVNKNLTGYAVDRQLDGVGYILFTEPVTEISGSLFSSYAYNVTEITLPESLTTIGNAAFGNCYGLTSITLPESVTTIGNSAFSYCDGLTSITLPESVTTIGDAAFSYCGGLTSITLPESVTTIGEGAFYGCDGLTSITLPESLTTIGNRAFYGCYNFKTFYVKSSTPPTISGDGYLFEYYTPTIYVPQDAVEAYKTAEGWSKYSSAIIGYNFEQGTIGWVAPMFFGTYYGGTKESGIGEYYVCFSDNGLSDGYLLKNSTYIYLDVYGPAHKESDKPVTLPLGTYTFDVDNTGAEYTIKSKFARYYLTDSSEVYASDLLQNATLEVTEDGILLTMVVKDVEYSIVYTGEQTFTNEAPTDQEFNLSNLTLWNWCEEQEWNSDTDTWEVRLAEDPNASEGKYFQITLLTPHGSEGYAGTYTASNEYNVNTFIPGYIVDNTIYACWYAELSGGKIIQSTSMRNGTITVTYNDDGSQTITLDCIDDWGYSIKGTLTGAPYGYATRSSMKMQPMKLPAKFDKMTVR